MKIALSIATPHRDMAGFGFFLKQYCLSWNWKEFSPSFSHSSITPVLAGSLEGMWGHLSHLYQEMIVLSLVSHITLILCPYKQFWTLNGQVQLLSLMFKAIFTMAQATHKFPCPSTLPTFYLACQQCHDAHLGLKCTWISWPVPHFVTVKFKSHLLSNTQLLTRT